MEVYTILESDEYINQSIVMVDSFLRHNPSHSFVVYTDEDFPTLPRVIVRPLKRSNDLPESRCYCSPLLVFLNSIEGFISSAMEYQGITFSSSLSDDRWDLVAYNSSSNEENPIVGDLAYNRGIPEFSDSGTIEHAMCEIEKTRVLNTRQFQPWVSQRDSYITMSFPWVDYTDALLSVEPYLDEWFKQAFIESSVKHSFNIAYRSMRDSITNIRTALREVYITK